MKAARTDLIARGFRKVTLPIGVSIAPAQLRCPFAAGARLHIGACHRQAPMGPPCDNPAGADAIGNWSVGLTRGSSLRELPIKPSTQRPPSVTQPSGLLGDILLC